MKSTYRKIDFCVGKQGYKRMVEYTPPKITIIVPVYNVERYLRRCLDSIAAQTFTEWECILIDDGSPDASGTICDEYAANDGRFRVIHQENRGVSAARNAGLDAARGDWIGFVDSDDWVDKDMLSALYACAVEKQAEVVVSGDYAVKGQRFKKRIPVYGWMDMPKDFAMYWQGPCAKLFLRRALHKENVRFPIGVRLAEDLYFTFQVFFKNKNIFALNEAYYYYFYNHTSAVHTISKEKIDDECYVLKMIEENLKKNNEYKDDWLDFLEDRKMRAKNKYVFSVTKPDIEAWNNCYPELTKQTIRSSSLFRKVILICFLKKIELPLLLYRLYKNLKSTRYDEVDE